MAQHKIYMTVGKNPRGEGLVAVLTQGSPQRGDEHITVLTVTVVSSNAEAHVWYEKMLREKPWETRQ